MGLLNAFTKSPVDKHDYLQIDNKLKVKELANEGKLKSMYLVPLRFNGTENERNTIFVTEEAYTLKEKYDNHVEELMGYQKVDGYTCYAKYKSNSLVASELVLVAKKDGEDVFTQTISVW